MPSPQKKVKFLPPAALGSPPGISRGIKWELCCLCQQPAKKTDPYVCPANNNCKASQSAGYESLGKHLIEFNKLGGLPSSLPYQDLDEGLGIAQTLSNRRAKWHRSCGLKFNKGELTRLQNRIHAAEQLHSVIEAAIASSPSSSRVLRSSQSPLSCKSSLHCFLCGGTEKWNKKLRTVTTPELHERVVECKAKTSDPAKRALLEGIFSQGTLHGQRVKYHVPCLLGLYDSCKSRDSLEKDLTPRLCESMAFADLVSYIDEKLQEQTAYIFPMATLSQMYQDRVAELLGAKKEDIPDVHSTRLRERIESRFQQLRCERPGKEYRFVPRDTLVSHTVHRAGEEDEEAVG